VLDRPALEPDAVLRYGPRPDQIADVRLPPGPGPHPLLVLLHGGFWRAEWDRRHTRPLADALADDGWIVVTPEYRRIGDPDVTPGRAWDAVAADVELALASAAGLVEAVAPVDARAPVIVGHSAGGQLALWSAARATTQGDARGAAGVAAPTPARATVALAPVADLHAAARLRLDGGAVEQLLGPDPDRYGEACPHCLPAPLGPVVVLHGADDEQVPAALSQSYAAAHPAPQLELLPGVEHFALIDPLSPAGCRVRVVLQALRVTPGARGGAVAQPTAS
jgi:acetyl esterase/lipase